MERVKVIRRLGTAAPAAIIYATVASVLTVVDLRPMVVALVAAMIVAPYVLALLVLADAPPLMRALLALLGPVVQWACLVLWVFLFRAFDLLPTWLMIASTIAPALVVLAGGVVSTARARGKLLLPATLWVVAIACGALALPSATRLAAANGVDTLAAITVLFAPAGAFGAWTGAALAALIALAIARSDARGDRTGEASA